MVIRTLLSLPTLLLLGCTGGGSAAPPRPPAAPTTSARPAQEVPAPPREPAYLLLEPVEHTSPEELPHVRALAEGETRQALEQLLEAPYLQWVLEVGEQSRALALAGCREEKATCAARFDHPAFFVIKRGGNRPHQGLVIEGGEGARSLPKAWYVEVDPRRAATLIPHEYGHALMFQLLPDEGPEHPPILPHTTPAITNDAVAFSEGWGIHFETLAADQPDAAMARVRRKRRRDFFSSAAPVRHGDSFLPALDLLSYSQSYRRYHCVKENCFAFLPRARGDLSKAPTAQEIMARWTDSTYDPALLRSLPQMVASEGVVATLFYRLATSDTEQVLPDPQRYAQMLAAFSGLRRERLQDQPMVLVFLEQLLQGADAGERRRIARTALEVLHYAPVLADAPSFYGKLHALGHAVDLKGSRKLLSSRADELAKAVDTLVEDPSRLLAKPIPELWLRHPGLSVGLASLGMPEQPLVFDLNTAPIAFLRTIPGMSAAMARALAKARGGHGFADLKELEAIPQLSPRVRRQISKMHIQR